MTHSRIGLTFHLGQHWSQCIWFQPEIQGRPGLTWNKHGVKDKKGSQLLVSGGLEVNSAPWAGAVHIFKSLSFMLLPAILKLIKGDFFLYDLLTVTSMLIISPSWRGRLKHKQRTNGDRQISIKRNVKMSAHRPLLQTQGAAVINRMEQGRLE